MTFQTDKERVEEKKKKKKELLDVCVNGIHPTLLLSL